MLLQPLNEFAGPEVVWWAITPILTLVAGALALMLVGALTPTWPRGLYGYVSAAIAAVAGVFAMILWDNVGESGPYTLVEGALAADRFALFATIAICIAVVLVSLLTADYLHGTPNDGPEVYALYLAAATGGIVMASANDLIVLFLGLETLSLALYVLAASNRRSSQSAEAGLKYFILGGFASALFVYGIALVYGGTGSTNISDMVLALQDTVDLQNPDSLTLAGIALMIAGLGFKVAAVPFHMWVPDVYQGSPSPVTAFMASVGKIAAFCAVLRVLVVALPFYRDDWRPVIWVLAVLSLLVGSVLAIVQDNVKRMLAYSSVSHAGFILVGVEAAGHTAGEADPGSGMSSVLLYLMLYAVLVIGSFAIVTVVSRSADGDTSLTAFVGLARRRPTLALAFTVLLLAQAGVPLTSGFIAKFGVIGAAVEQKSYVLAVIAMVSAVIAAFLYLRIMVTMWLADTVTEDAVAEDAIAADAGAAVPVPFAAGLTIALAVAFTLFVGIVPGWLVDAANDATAISTAFISAGVIP
jgi:NADH-quinone oxidoreductase subunit N